MAMDEKSKVAIGTVLGVAIGAVAANIIGKGNVVGMHWISPSGTAWYALGLPALKKFYLIAGDIIWVFLREALPGAMSIFSEVDKLDTPLVPEDYIYGGTLKDGGSLSLPG
jgi:hypothetical protein